MLPAALFDPIASADWALLVAAPFIGSFLGVLIRRLPQERPVARGRSACEHCGAALPPLDLVPILSWLWLRGRCRHCGAALGWFYPGVELAALAIAAAAVAIDGGIAAWLDALFGWWLLALAWIDARHGLLPDALTLPLVVAGLVAAWLLDPPALAARALGAAAGYLVMQAVGWVYLRLRGREGLGGGDAKLLAAAGAWVGVLALPAVILLAALAALAAATAMQIAGARLRASSALPFGPFLGFAAWLVWLFGPPGA